MFSCLLSLLVISSEHFVDNLTYISISLMSLLVIISKHFVDNLTYIFLIIFLRLHACRQSLLLCFVGSALGETLGCHGGFHLVSDFEVCL
jgi:hypothetical protein